MTPSFSNLRAKALLSLLFTSLFMTQGCVKMPQEQIIAKPHIALPASEKCEIAKSLYEYYLPHDLSTAWGRELACGWSFAEEGDFYRAITCFRKATFLSRSAYKEEDTDKKNKLLIETTTGIIASYVFSDKYAQAIDAWEGIQAQVDIRGKAEAKWLLFLLVEAYSSLSDGMEQAIALASYLPPTDPDYEKLMCYLVLRGAAPEKIASLSQSLQTNGLSEKTTALFNQWHKEKKSPTTATVLNLILPGSGYAYIGQYPTAFTSLTVNALFIGATVEFFKAGQPLAGLIALGLEMGWWGGGAMGAHLSTEQYNNRRWTGMAEKFMKKENLYPEAMLWKNVEEMKAQGK